MSVNEPRLRPGDRGQEALVGVERAWVRAAVVFAVLGDSQLVTAKTLWAALNSALNTESRIHQAALRQATRQFGDNGSVSAPLVKLNSVFAGHMSEPRIADSIDRTEMELNVTAMKLVGEVDRVLEDIDAVTPKGWWTNDVPIVRESFVEPLWWKLKGALDASEAYLRFVVEAVNDITQYQLTEADKVVEQSQEPSSPAIPSQAEAPVGIELAKVSIAS